MSLGGPWQAFTGLGEGGVSFGVEPGVGDGVGGLGL